jgi:hypothetical protein
VPHVRSSVRGTRTKGEAQRTILLNLISEFTPDKEAPDSIRLCCRNICSTGLAAGVNVAARRHRFLRHPAYSGVPWRDLQFRGPLLETRDTCSNTIVLSIKPARGCGVKINDRLSSKGRISPAAPHPRFPVKLRGFRASYACRKSGGIPLVFLCELWDTTVLNGQLYRLS